MVWMFEAFRDDEKVDFKFLHVFIKIEGCEKWAQVRLSLRKGKEYVPDTPAAGAVDGRADGHKKAKAARDEALAGAKLQASIETLKVHVLPHAWFW